MSSIHTRVYHNTDQTYTVFRDSERNGDGDQSTVAQLDTIDAVGAWHRERGGCLGAILRDETGRYRQGLYFDPIPLDALPVIDSVSMVLASVPAGADVWERLLNEAAQECAQ